jgi:hypothetical protein
MITPIKAAYFGINVHLHACGWTPMNRTIRNVSVYEKKGTVGIPTAPGGREV